MNLRSAHADMTIRPRVRDKLFNRGGPWRSEVAGIEGRAGGALRNLPRRLYEPRVGCPVVSRGCLIVDQRAAVVVLVSGEDRDDAGTGHGRPEAIARGYALRTPSAPQRIHNVAAVGKGRLMHKNKYVSRSGFFGLGQIFFQPVKLPRK